MALAPFLSSLTQRIEELATEVLPESIRGDVADAIGPHLHPGHFSGSC